QVEDREERRLAGYGMRDLDLVELLDRACPRRSERGGNVEGRFRAHPHSATSVDVPHCFSHDVWRDVVLDLAASGDPCETGSVTCVGSSVKAVFTGRSGPQVLVKVERPQRSEDERP